MAWYYAQGDERIGPVDDEDFTALVASGAVTGQTLVWREGMADWQPYRTIAGRPVIPAGVEGSDEAGATAPCVECGLSFPTDELIVYEQHRVCAACKDVFFQRIREGGGTLVDWHYGGFWVRFFARFIDGCILGFVGVLQSLIEALFGIGPADPAGLFGPAAAPSDYVYFAVATLLSMAIGITYEVWFIGKYGATPGKMAFGLKVIRSDGSRVSYWRAFGRYLGTLLSSFTLMIGYIIAAFDSEKRALHDHICDTRVVRK